MVNADTSINTACAKGLTNFKAKTASAATATLPKTADSNWIAVSLALFLLGTALLGAARRC